MKFHLISIAILILICSASTSATAQYLQREIISSSGSYTSSEGLNLSWTLAELSVTSKTGEEVAIHQGFEQFFKNSITSIDDLNDPSSIRIWPNPFEELIEISISKLTINDVSIRVNRIGGESLLEEKLSFNTFTLNTSQWISGVYIVVLSGKEGWRITKKIVKL